MSKLSALRATDPEHALLVNSGWIPPEAVDLAPWLCANHSVTPAGLHLVCKRRKGHDGPHTCGSFAWAGTYSWPEERA